MTLTQRLTLQAIKLRQMAANPVVTLDAAVEMRLTADMLLATANTVEKLVAAIRKSEREHANMDEDAPLDPGCLRCTDGTTPTRYETGPCAHHQRVAVLAEFGQLN